MPTPKRARVQAEIKKRRAKIVEEQARLKELEAQDTELENMEIVDAVRGLGVPLDNLGAILQSIKNDPALAALTSGQVDPRLAAPQIISDNGDTNADKEDETE